MPDLISFNEFVAETASAKVEHHRETIAAALLRPSVHNAGFLQPVAAVAADDAIEAEFTKMKNYVLTKYKDITDVKINHSFLGPGGNSFDCVPYEQQPTYQAAKKAGYNLPSSAPVPSRSSKSVNANQGSFAPLVSPMLPPLRRGLVDCLGNPMACPDGRVPLRRVTIAQMARLGKFENFFRKYPFVPPYAGTLGVTEIHHHAICTDTNHLNGRNYFGCSTWLNVWDVNPSPGVFGLSQLWMIGSTTAGVVQTIESGWQTSNYWGTSSPVLFVFYNPNGYDMTSCGYVSNQNHFGFVQQSGSGWIIGDAMPQPYSTVNGDQRGNQMQWQIDSQGNWWLYFGSGDQTPAPLGYFPAGLYQNGTLAQSAQTLQFGGEVASQNPGDPTYPSTGKMGSGTVPFPNSNNNFGEVAFQKQIKVQLANDASLEDAQLEVSSNPNDAGYSAVTSTDPGSWGTYMFFGGARSA